jgi:hypothetical protein
VRKISKPSGSRINPIVVESFEFVFETQIFRIDKRQRGVADLETVLRRFDFIFDFPLCRRSSDMLSIFTVSITTGGGCELTLISRGSITATPSCVGNQSRPSLARTPAGERPPLHSALSIPSDLP